MPDPVPACYLNNPSPPLTVPAGNDAAIEAIGYYRGSQDVPGQGIHYFKSEFWDDVFDPCRPEGLVYSGNRLVAQLYVISGGPETYPPATAGIGWNGWDPGTSGNFINGVNIDGAGFSCTTPPCSWAAAEGWHAHANLCTTDIGTTSAFTIPGQTEANCDAGSNPDPECTTPVTAQPCWAWDHQVGWMGHLWNHFINQNKEPVEKNGRFSDCAPPAPAYNQCAM
jgi:hypothetical protein